jgi:hypothetical protein
MTNTSIFSSDEFEKKECLICLRKWTKLMMMQLDTTKTRFLCIGCYNRSGK